MYFYAAGPSQYWYVHTNASGAVNGCHMYTPTVCGSLSCNVVNWSAWYLPVSTSYNGYYAVGVWLACNDAHYTNNAVRYKRYAYGTAAGSTQTYVVDQTVPTCGSTNYMTSSAYFQGSSGGYMRMVDKSKDYPKPANADYLQYLPA